HLLHPLTTECRPYPARARRTRSSAMSTHNGMRYSLLGLALILLIGLPSYFASRDSLPVAPQATPEPSTSLQSLATLDGKAPSKRTLDIQHWQTAEGARVLFVEARQLPMFDLRLTFAAGSSHDADVPGLAALTNTMLNEGVPGMDDGVLAERFERLGAELESGANRDMASASKRNCTEDAQHEPALSLFEQVIGQPSCPADAL